MALTSIGTADSGAVPRHRVLLVARTSDITVLKRYYHQSLPTPSSYRQGGNSPNKRLRNVWALWPGPRTLTAFSRVPATIACLGEFRPKLKLKQIPVNHAWRPKGRGTRRPFGCSDIVVPLPYRGSVLNTTESQEIRRLKGMTDVSWPTYCFPKPPPPLIPRPVVWPDESETSGLQCVHRCQIQDYVRGMGFWLKKPHTHIYAYTLIHFTSVCDVWFT